MWNFDTPKPLDTPKPRTPDVVNEKQTPDPSVEKLTEKSSTAIAPHVINLALQEAVKYLKEKRWEMVTWIDFNNVPEATRFNTSRNQYKLDLANPAVKALFDKCVSDDYTDVNKFLKSKWFTIQLDKGDPGSLYIAATFKHQVDWNPDGKPVWSGTLWFKEDRNDQIKSIKMPQEKVNIHNITIEWKERMIYEVTGANWDKVYMMDETANNRNISPFGLENLVKSIDKNINISQGKASDKEFHFPQIKYNKSQDLTWLIGTGVNVKDGQWYQIKQAKVETELELSPEGAKASAAAAVEVKTRGMIIPPPSYSISWPLITWMKKGDVITFAWRMWRDNMVSAKKE